MRVRDRYNEPASLFTHFLIPFRVRVQVLYNSRSPRPGELDGRDYHFRTRGQIEAFRPDKRYALLDVRGDLQALDLEELQGLLGRGDVIFEGNTFIGMPTQRLPNNISSYRLRIPQNEASENRVNS